MIKYIKSLLRTAVVYLIICFILFVMGNSVKEALLHETHLILTIFLYSTVFFISLAVEYRKENIKNNYYR